MERATNWGDIPLLLSVDEIRRNFGLSRHNAYALANLLGLRISGKKLVVSRARLQAYLEGGQSPDSPDRDAARHGRRVG